MPNRPLVLKLPALGPDHGLSQSYSQRGTSDLGGTSRRSRALPMMPMESRDRRGRDAALDGPSRRYRARRSRTPPQNPDPHVPSLLDHSRTRRAARGARRGWDLQRTVSSNCPGRTAITRNPRSSNASRCTRSCVACSGRVVIRTIHEDTDARHTRPLVDEVGLDVYVRRRASLCGVREPEAPLVEEV